MSEPGLPYAGPARAQTQPEANPFSDINYWAALGSGLASWRWMTSPHLYFRPGLSYRRLSQPVTVTDILGRETQLERPYDCQVNPASGKFEKLYVQAPNSICELPFRSQPDSCTWKRTPIRNVAPGILRVANSAFMFVPRHRKHDFALFTEEDWWTVAGMWIPAVVMLNIMMFSPDYQYPEGKDVNMYLPLLNSGLRYPRLARNFRENRDMVQRQQLPVAVIEGTYRTFRPRFLNYLVVDSEGEIISKRMPVTNQNHPFIFISYSSVHFPVVGRTDEEKQRARTIAAADLLIAATNVIVYQQNITPEVLQANPAAGCFWTSANCIPEDETVDAQGQVVPVTTEAEQHQLADNDTYSISDIIRAASEVVVIAGNPNQPWDPFSVHLWGSQVWTLPEVILSRGTSITVANIGLEPDSSPRYDIRVLDKSVFPIEAWPSDAIATRQLLENYTSIHLSRLELVKIALACVMSRTLRPLRPGDRVYALMGLLRVRPPIDRTDSAFQAFARLSMPQDSDRLMERMVCLLPESDDPVNKPNDVGADWERMTDQYRASPWEIYPTTQVCAVGENDTVVLDGAKGAQIQWACASPVRTVQSNNSFRRNMSLQVVTYSPTALFVGVILAALYSGPVQSFGIVLLIFTACLMLASPLLIRVLYDGKLWFVEPCYFGFEGYIPIEVLEEKIFGLHLNRLSWSPWGSPLSRHVDGTTVPERRAKAVDDSLSMDTASTAETESTPILTYTVKPIDPCASCTMCADQPETTRMCRYHPTPASCLAMSYSPMGQMKVFTLVDTMSMSVTLFYAVRPPTALIVGGSEGGMQRAIACSFDVVSGTYFRETVLRIPTEATGKMESLARIRLGLKRPFEQYDVERAVSSSAGGGTAPAPVSYVAPQATGGSYAAPQGQYASGYQMTNGQGYQNPGVQQPQMAQVSSGQYPVANQV